MAKEWAIQFYASKAWRTTRTAYMHHVHWSCERCTAPAALVHHRIYLTPANINNYEVSLSWNNLEAVCRVCHENEHEEIRGRNRSIMNEMVEVVGANIERRKGMSSDAELDSTLSRLISG